MKKKSYKHKEKLGHNYGKLLFTITDDLYARLIVQLRNEQMGKAEFFNAVIRAFVDDDERIISFLNEYRENKLSQSRLKKMSKERQKANDYESKFGISKDEIEDIFDLFDEEGL